MSGSKRTSAKGKKLTLKKSTVRDLTTGRRGANVRGGVPTTSKAISCARAGCKEVIQ